MGYLGLSFAFAKFSTKISGEPLEKIFLFRESKFPSCSSTLRAFDYYFLQVSIGKIEKGEKKNNIFIKIFSINIVNVDVGAN